MKVSKLTKYLFFLLGFGPVILMAQKEITLGEALSYAIRHKSDAKKALLDIENAEYQIQETKAKLYPQISGNAGITNNPLLQKSALPGDLVGQPGTTILATFGQKWNASAGVGLSQRLFDQAVFTGLRAARSTREFYQLNAELTKEDLIQRVAENYYQVYIEMEKLKVVDSSLANTQKVREVMLGQYTNGLARKIDLDRLDVKITNLKTNRQKVINALDIQKNTLKFFMGMDISTDIVLPELFMGEPLVVEEGGPLVDVSHLLAYRLLEQQEQLLIQQKKSVQAEYYPTLSLEGNYSYQGLGNDFPIFPAEGDNANWFDVASLGLALKVPLFKGFSVRSRVRQADVELKGLKEDLKDAKLSLQLDYLNARAQFENSVETIKNQHVNVSLAQSVLDDTNNNYFHGLATLTDLLDAQTSLTESKNNLNQALLELKVAELRLLKSKGELLSLVPNTD